MESISPGVILLLIVVVPFALMWKISKMNETGRKLQRQTDQAAFDLQPYANHCMTCGSDFKTLPAPQRGSTSVEVALWIMIFPAGIVYSVWRRQKAGKITCIICKSDAVVPALSPAAQAHAAGIKSAIRA